MSATRAALLMACAISVSLGCGAEETAEPVDSSARDFEDQECAACGMIVREQPSPRGQQVHRDGTRVYACSIADLHAYAAAPSSHGEAIATYVEVLPVDADPAASSTEARPWVPAEDASFVLGVERNNVMGRPVLAYATRADAESAAERLGGRVVDYAGLQRALDAN